jgi:NTF2 fold immunity protein
MVTYLFRRVAICAIYATITMCGILGTAMSGNDDSDEGMAMFLRRSRLVETVSSDIALRLAEMLFVRHYGQEHTNEQLPLVVVDRGDRWEVHGREGAAHRLTAIIKKADGRILELVSW